MCVCVCVCVYMCVCVCERERERECVFACVLMFEILVFLKNGRLYFQGFQIFLFQKKTFKSKYTWSKNSIDR